MFWFCEKKLVESNLFLSCISLSVRLLDVMRAAELILSPESFPPALKLSGWPIRSPCTGALQSRAAASCSWRSSRIAESGTVVRDPVQKAHIAEDFTTRPPGSIRGRSINSLRSLPTG